ncbi:GntR family transcriptional regulator [Streptomyces sp. NBC_00872]|uniref:GntR family transcriptional regulator n=1 Tax=Streptomyces sp. NBC_00872 TaxID=2903686 RepID=UPI00386ED8DD|nr:GntR family transcriptional regulator [Streptomyces sp. NBC_00872]
MRDTRSPHPVLKRERVRDHLLGLVDTRRPGDAIPSERTLCAELGVSRPTLRTAVDELVATGLLVREHGRGMFVAPAKITQELVAEDRSAVAPRAPGVWSARVLEFRTVGAGARVGRRLGLSPAAEVVHVARLRFVDGGAVALEYLHLPAELVPGLTPARMESGFYAYLREERRITLSEAVQSIEPTVLSEDEAELLGVPVFSPALLFDRITSDASGRPVEYVRSLYRGDRYRIVSRLALGTAAEDRPAPDASRSAAWWGTVE